MGKKYKVSLILVIVLLFITGILTIRYEKNHTITKVKSSYEQMLKPAPFTEEEMKGIEVDFKVTEEYETHLPLIIIDTAGVEPPIYTERREFNGEWIFMNIEGVEPYVDGTISLIDNEGYNHIFDAPAVRSLIKIKRRGNTSMLYDKGQYMVKLITEKGEENKLDLLGMGAENEWILNGSTADESLIRNYLAYRITSHIMPYTPDYNYCEVLEKKEDGYYYKGVYLLGENIKQGVNRVNISPYRSKEYYNSFLVRRDRYDEDDIMLYTYATQNGLSTGYLGLLYPGKNKASAETVSYVEEKISEVEQILYSDDFKVFSVYPDYIDVDSFVDYFLVNEFFASYDAGNFSTYMYQDLGGKLCIGPVWDFDSTMDNYIDETLQTKVTAFQVKPWFDRLMRDKTFINKLEKRYLELRRSYFSDSYVEDTINEIWKYLGAAQAREWTRWEKVYRGTNKFTLESYLDDEGDVVERDSIYYENEIYRIKTILKKHGHEIYKHLELLKRSTVWTTGWSNRKDIALIVVMLTLCISIIYIRRN